MAQYYHQSGAGGYQGNYVTGGVSQPYQPPYFQPQTPYKAEAPGTPLLYRNEPDVLRSPPTTHASLYTGPLPQLGITTRRIHVLSIINPFDTPCPTAGEQPYHPPLSNNMYVGDTFL
jgi:hypothetical protein